jgi:hypothetical protein
LFAQRLVTHKTHWAEVVASHLKDNEAYHKIVLLPDSQTSPRDLVDDVAREEKELLKANKDAFKALVKQN